MGIPFMLFSTEYLCCIPNAFVNIFLQREQEEIRGRIVEANRGLTWDDTRSMPLTSRVCHYSRT